MSVQEFVLAGSSVFCHFITFPKCPESSIALEEPKVASWQTKYVARFKPSNFNSPPTGFESDPYIKSFGLRCTLLLPAQWCNLQCRNHLYYLDH